MDDSKFPRIRRFEIHSDPVCALDLSADQSRFMSDAEIRRLRDALNADADAADEETVARVTTDELRSLSLQLVIGGEETPETLARRVMHEISNELHDMSERASDGGTATLWQVDHADGDWPWIVDHDSLDDPECIGPQLDDVTDEQLVEAVRNMLDADPGTFVIRRREKAEPLHLEIATLPRFGKNAALAQMVIDTAKERGVAIEMPVPTPETPTWTAKPPERDCWWKSNRDGRNIPTSLQYRDGRYWTDQSSYSQGQMIYSGENGGRFLPIPCGIPVCPKVTS